MANVFSLQPHRELGLLSDTAYRKAIRDSEHLVRRLKKTRVLAGHTGCVNTVAWNESGSRLISGADDYRLNIYDTATNLLRKSIRSTHQSNIFSAKFLPCSGDCKAVSCAGVGTLEYTELTPMGDYTGHIFKCQTSITYQVGTIPVEPHAFLTCEEKGYVRLFDLRVKNSCTCEGCDKDVLFEFPQSVSCMAVRPLAVHYLAVGLGDGSVRLLDRRMAIRPVGQITPDLAEACSCKSYRPATLRERSYRITSVQFNSDGSQLLASISDDHVYLFNSRLSGGERPTRPTYLSHCQRIPGKQLLGETVRRKPMSAFGAEPESSQPSEDSPPVKKIRLRGDWSDTGPRAVPESQQEAGPEAGNIMNHMSRMFTQWVDMSLTASGRPRVHPPSGRREAEGAGEREEALQSSSSSDNSFTLFSDDASSPSLGTPPPSSHATPPPSHSPPPSSHAPLCSTQTDPLNTPQAMPKAEVPTLSPSTQGCSTEDHSTREEEERLLELADGSEAHQQPPHDKTISSDLRTEANIPTDKEGALEGCVSGCGLHQEQGGDMVENRGTNCRLPTIEIIEDETDSDDVRSCDQQSEGVSNDVVSCDMSCDQVGEEPEEEDTSRHLQPFMVYKGHRNSRTMIKQANFWGDRWVMSGSDCGRVFVWDKWSGEVVNLLMADSHVVNCIQPHPEAYVIATSGIDYNIKMWEPVAEWPASLDDLDQVVQRNEAMLRESRNTITVPSTFILRILAYLNRRRRMSAEHAEVSGESDSDS